MKRIIILVICVLYITSITILGAEVSNSQIEESEEQQKQSLIYKLNNGSMYSKWGFSQKDVIKQYLSKNNGFRSQLNISDMSEGATYDNIEYGDIVGVCKIDFEKLDKYVVSGTLGQNVDKVINILDQCYVELKYNDMTLGYMNINEDERISHFTEPGILKSDYINEILSKETSVEPVIYLIEDNEYIQGIYVKSENSIITYKEFNNSNNNEQFYANDIVSALNEVNKRYLIINPRVDYELIKTQEIQQLIDEGKQRDVILYSISAVLGVVLVLVIVIFFKIVRKE